MGWSQFSSVGLNGVVLIVGCSYFLFSGVVCLYFWDGLNFGMVLNPGVGLNSQMVLSSGVGLILGWSYILDRS